MDNPQQQKEAWQHFEELLRFTLVGFIGGLTAGSLLDFFQYPVSPLGQWLVRALAGQGAGLVMIRGAVIRERRRGAFAMARTYGHRRLAILTLPWIIDAASRRWGGDTNGLAGFYIPYFYALTAQMDANLRGWVRIRQSSGNRRAAWEAYIRDPGLLSGLLILVGALLVLLGLRSLGFQPLTYTRTAGETLLVNLCWLPALIAWLKARKPSP